MTLERKPKQPVASSPSKGVNTVTASPAQATPSPSSQQQQQPTLQDHPVVVPNDDHNRFSSGDSVNSDENEARSADDEGSRDEAEEDDMGGRTDPPREESVGLDENGDVAETPRMTRRKVETLKQGLAARRIQRTWKHFYEEVIK